VRVSAQLAPWDILLEQIKQDSHYRLSYGAACYSQYYIRNIMLMVLGSPNKSVFEFLSYQHNVGLCKLGTKEF